MFSGLLTMTNEYGQIHVCDLVPTKAHSQFTIALTQMHESLDLYGLRQPCIVFTDTMADKAFLKSTFPSLKEGVTLVSSYDGLEPLSIPSTVQIQIKTSLLQIEATILSLVDTFSDDKTMELFIGLDTEWSVDLYACQHGLDD